MSKMKTTTHILKALEAIMPMAEYLEACNASRGVGETRSRMEERMRFLVRSVEDVAYQFDQLHEKVDEALSIQGEVKALVADSFRALDHGHVITERFPVDDEHQAAA